MSIFLQHAFDCMAAAGPGNPTAGEFGGNSEHDHRDDAFDITHAPSQSPIRCQGEQRFRPRLGRKEIGQGAINSHLYSTETGRYDDSMDANGSLTGHQSLHTSAFALAFGIGESTEAPRVAADVASRGMVCSVYGAAFLADGLYRADHRQAALDLLTSTGISSWMNMIQLGAGATAKSWAPSLKSKLTYSHPWAASPAFVVPADLFGIQPLEAGHAR